MTGPRADSTTRSYDDLSLEAVGIHCSSYKDSHFAVVKNEVYIEKETKLRDRVRSSHGTPQPSLDCAFTLNQVQLRRSGRAPAAPRASETFHRPRASAPSGPPPLCRVSALTRRESGDPRNLAGDLCREHREVLLVAFEVG
ncbi:hypothetical protein GH733_001158 [Mirounga leonina]|nr:hypothetical protein GH733_001158 [Mirounga leonina]